MKEHQFEIIPAIDIFNNQVVRLHKGNYEEVKVYYKDPYNVIEHFKDSGIRRVHIVDLNAAKDGNIKTNQPTIHKILKNKNHLILEIGGGIRTKNVINEYLTLGFDYLILGTIAIKNPSFVEEVIHEFSSKHFIIGVDAYNEQVRVSGWLEDSNIHIFDFFKKIESWGIEQVIFTDISRDGTLSGPNIELLKKILEYSSLKFISSGGISSDNDVEKLISLNHPNLIGVIIGKAFYENKVNLKKLINISKHL